MDIASLKYHSWYANSHVYITSLISVILKLYFNCLAWQVRLSSLFSWALVFFCLSALFIHTIFILKQHHYLLWCAVAVTTMPTAKKKRGIPLWCLCIDCCSRFNGRPVEDIPFRSQRTIQHHCQASRSLRYPHGTKHHRRSCQPEAEGLTTYPVSLHVIVAWFPLNPCPYSRKQACLIP